MIIIKTSQLLYALDVLAEVKKGNGSLDSQSAHYLLNYVERLERNDKEVSKVIKAQRELIEQYQNKLSRRNVQIADLKRRLQDLKDTVINAHGETVSMVLKCQQNEEDPE